MGSGSALKINADKVRNLKEVRGALGELSKEAYGFFQLGKRRGDSWEHIEMGS